VFFAKDLTMRIRRADQRGSTQYDWLDSRHSFSFGDYADQEWMGWSVLRVLNDDKVVPGGGFPRHGHRDMEIVTYVLSGSIVHRDSQGNEATLKAGELQHMSAGTGIHHSEHNGSGTDPLHFLQIWLLPDETGIEPSYSQTWIDPAALDGHFRPLITPDGQGRTLKINQNATMYGAKLRAGSGARRIIGKDRAGYLHVIEGVVQAGGTVLSSGDGACLFEGTVSVNAVHDCHVILFDLP
jgi:redox-sensitive bicupin YhaK (pirin superfamily)